MNCRRVKPLLSDHLDGLLPSPAAAAVTAHLADCPACRRLRADMLAASHILRELLAPPPSLALRERTLAAWTDRNAASSQFTLRSLIRTRPTQAAWVAGLSLVTAALILVPPALDRAPHHETDPGAQNLGPLSLIHI